MYTALLSQLVLVRMARRESDHAAGRDLERDPQPFKWNFNSRGSLDRSYPC